MEMRIPWPLEEHICEFCNRNFVRSDVRRLHYKKCRARISRGALIPQPAKRGRKTKSCDSCALSKRACDKKQPCSDCTSRRSTCAYTRAPVESSEIAGASVRSSTPSTETSSISPVDVSDVPAIGTDFGFDFQPDTANVSQSSRWLTKPQSPKAQGTTALAFLRHFTSTKGIATTFEYTTHQGYLQLLKPDDFLFEIPFDVMSILPVTSSSQLETAGIQYMSDSNPSPWMQFDASNSFEGFPNSTLSPGTLAVPQPMDQLGTIDMVDWIIDPLFPKSRDILMRFRKVGLPGHLAERIHPAMSVQSRMCLHFFGPPNIKRLTDLFWKHWYPHCPIIHFQTFDLVTAPAPLVIAMALLGAVASPASNDKDLARKYFDLAELIAFEEFEDFTNCPLTGLEYVIPRPTAIQAAFLISCLQNWEGDSEGSSRSRRDRFTTLVNAVRDSGLILMAHTTKELGTEFNWERYVAKEECIRVSTFIFLVNTSFVYFNNSTSRLDLPELECRLLSPQACFRAETARSCYQQMQILCPPGSLRATMPLWRAVEVIRNDAMTPEEISLFSTLDTLNLFSIISGLVLWLFQQPSQLFNIPSFEHQASNMLHTWTIFWAARSDKCLSSEDMNNYGNMDRTGFYEHADEYRQYALGLLRLRQASQYNLENRSTNPTILPLQKSDETSMEQVSELLSLLQTLNIQ